MPDTSPPAGRFGPDVYATWRRSSLGEITEALEHRLILRLAGKLEGQSVLDVGCGDGTLARIAARHGTILVVGCDPDPRMIARAAAPAARGEAGVGLAVARAQALPFADGSFDVVTCIAVLAFVPDTAAAIAEMARVLRPGGRLVIGDLGRWSYWAARRRIRGWLGAELWRGARFRGAGALARMVRRAGLVVGAVNGAIFYPPWTVLARRMAPLDPAAGRGHDPGGGVRDGRGNETCATAPLIPRRRPGTPRPPRRLAGCTGPAYRPPKPPRDPPAHRNRPARGRKTKGANVHGIRHVP